MRVFFGLEPDAATTVKIADWRDRHTLCNGKPVAPANFHITLAFAGELADHAIEELCTGVDGWLAQHMVQGAQLHLNQSGYWPKPGIFWLGPAAWPDTLTRLAQKLNSLASSVGAKRDRSVFQPHITLYRRCQAPPPAPTAQAAIEMRYGHCALFESRQGKSGVSYHVLHEWQLQTASE
jgi:2'-5' RNA ligase